MVEGYKEMGEENLKLAEEFTGICPECNKERHLCECPLVYLGSFAKYVEE